MNQEVRKFLAELDGLNLAKLINNHPEIHKIFRDVSLIRNISGSAQQLIISGVAQSIREGGWDEILAGSEKNTNINALLSNPIIILYTQLVVALVLAGMAEPMPVPTEN